MAEDRLDSIDGKLTTIARLLALNLVKGRPVNEQMQILRNAGMSISEIASTLGRTPNNVRVQLHQVRQKDKASGSVESGQEE